eukprot:TRINITY_DN7542_c0_g1_i1.p1 TRINITY_DN7542_c0_g1~~TRINITY_DN7542_c0_g1_i1.p1  ORF type:complete len:494 (+),score=111.31 TRINITY_DN7542_c0_g1_i1:50-1531(+)
MTMLEVLSQASPTTLVLTTVAVILVAFYFTRRMNGKKHPPLVREGSSIPLLATLMTAKRFGENPRQVLAEFQAKYGDVFTLNLIVLTITFIIGPEGHRFFFAAKENSLSFMEAVKRNAVSAIGRTALRPEYHQPAFYDGVAKPMIKNAFMKSEFLNRFGVIIRDESAKHYKRWAASAEPLDLFIESSNLVMMINIRVMLGDEFALKHGDAISRAFYDIEEYGAHPLSVLFPSLPTYGVRRAYKARKETYKLFREEIERRLNANPREKHDDYLQTWIDTHEKDVDLGHFLPGHLLAMMFAAHTNTAGTYGWTVAKVAVDDQVFKAVRDEVIALENENIPLEKQPILKTDLLDGCMKETVRLYGPLQMLRFSREDVEFAGFTIPKNHYVAVCPNVTHNDDHYFPNASKFDPSRWLDTNLRKSSVQSMTFTQFGFGMHRCLGEHYVTLLLRHSWIELFRDYKVEVVGGKLPKDKVKPAGTSFAAEPLLIRLHKIQN